jgi:hypothetical protein
VSGAPTRVGAGWGVGIAAVVAAVLAVLALSAGPGGGDDRALDPRSHGRLGTSALVALAGELGADVEISDRLPGDDTDVTLLLTDLLDTGQHDELERWVDRGGTLVVVDPASLFAPAGSDAFSEVEDIAGPETRARCDILALDDIAVDRVDPRNGGVLYDVPAGSDACVGIGGEAYIVATPAGGGTVVAIGGSGMVVNAGLAEGENAPVVAALLAPGSGTRLTVLEPGPLAGPGERTLVDLVSPGVKAAVAQMVVAFVVYVLWRSRRLGAPVVEPQPVAVAGSELVSATGSLLDRTGSPQHAADLLRGDLRRFLADRLGVPPEAPPATIAAVAADRVGADRARLTWALSPGPVADDAQLVALAQTIDAVRQEVLAHV